MMQLPSFPEHDNFQITDQKWIGNVPSHWELRANKYIFSLKKQAVGKRSAEYDLLSLTLRGIIKRDMENPEGKFPAEFDTYQEVSPGDFVFCHFDVEETPRTVGLSDFHGMITGAYTVYRTQKSVDPRFLLYFYLNADSNKKLRSLYTGLRNTITKDAFASFKTPMPPLPEQRAIAAFLDNKCAKIDEAVKIKEDQITLLRERRQIIIQDAVTRGLNPEASMKDSGIDWIGQVPAGWGLKRIKHLVNQVSDKVSSKETSLRYVGMENVESWSGRLIDGSAEVEGLAASFSPGDVIFGKLRPYLAKAALMDFSGICSTEFLVFRPGNEIEANFFAYLLRSSDFVSYIDSSTYGSKMPRAAPDFVANTFLPVPTRQEQQAILTFLDEQCSKSSETVQIKENQIAALKEYKTSLINAAVTGKIKVV